MGKSNTSKKVTPKKDLYQEYLERTGQDILQRSVTNLCVEMTEVREILKELEGGNLKGSDIGSLERGLELLKQLKKAGVKEIHF